ncbi:MAG: autotransporter-associated beta strand repeat-containing protein [Kiritimatiellae bacterium]|nr:autotransporter-associated beta strand repeat-containing protein [Kiritimatiellia bacterium]
MSRKLDKLVVGAMALLSTGVFADTHVWKAEGRVNDWNWNEPGNYDSSLGAAGVPEAGDIVQLPPSADIYVKGTDQESCSIVSSLEQIVPVDAESRIIFDLGDADLTVNGAISSVLDRSSMSSSSTAYRKGCVVKRGTGTLRLNRAFVPGNDDKYDSWAYYTGIVCEEGVLKLPEFETETSAYPQFYFGHVAVSNGATIFTASCSTKALPTTIVRGLWGSGVVTNDFIRYRKLSVNGNVDDASVFDGKLQGSIRFSSYGRVMMRGTENTHNHEFEVYATGDRTSPWRSSDGTATIGVMKLGKIGEPSTLGPEAHIRYGGYGGNYLYLGTGETTDKKFQFYSPTDGTAGFDAGVTGGITFTGDFTFPDVPGVAVLRLMGGNAQPCVIAGPVSASSNCVMFVKQGSGTWRFADDDCNSESRTFFSSMALQEGTLQFDSMEERGWRCSLGLATNTTEVYYGSRNDAAHSSEFAYYMGTNIEAGVTFEFVGTNGAYATRRQLGLCGKLTMKNHTSHPWRFSGVQPATSGAKTLVLDSSENVANELAGVKDTLENPITIEKTGAGTWTLNGSNTIHGMVSVKNGTLKVRNTSGRFRYYRLTIRDSHNPGESGKINIGEIALYDAEGKQVNKGLSRNDNYHAISAGQCAFMRFGFHWPNSFQSLCDGKSNQTYLWFADGGKKDSEGGTLLKYDRNNTLTHAPFLMMLADDAAEVKSYDVLLFSDVVGSKGACPGDWILEGSPDMLHWTKLHEITNETFPNDITGTDMWVGAKVQAERDKSLPVTHEGGFPVNISSATIPCTVLDNATVSVAKGATLETSDSIAISRLRLDGSSAGNGAISGFSFAEDGDLEVVNLNADDRVEIDVDISNVEGKSNLSKWGLTATAADGSRLLRKAIMSATGKLSICANGLVVIVK